MSTDRQLITEAYNQVAIWKTEAQYLKKRLEKYEAAALERQGATAHLKEVIEKYGIR